jgi:hypothetical protein
MLAGAVVGAVGLVPTPSNADIEGGTTLEGPSGRTRACRFAATTRPPRVLMRLTTIMLMTEREED